MAEAVAQQVEPRLYEGMFLLSPGAGTNLGEAIDHLKELFDRAGAEVVSLRKWDDRKLAYPIRGQKRGMYVLAFFKATPSKLVNFDRDCNLSEKIIRSIVLKADHLGEAEMELETKEVGGEAEAKLRGDRDEDAGEQGAAEAAGAEGEEAGVAAEASAEGDDRS
jgi:small subunit ribosomal protein S6